MGVTSAEREPFFTTKTLAHRLNISERTVRTLLNEKRIPSYKVGGARRIDPADVAAYLARNRTARR